MRRPRSRSLEDLDAVDVLLDGGQDMDVLLDDEDQAADEVHDVLHVLALEAMARRARSPGDEKPWLLDQIANPPGDGPDGQGERGGAPDAPARGPVRRALARHPVRWAVVVLLVVAVAAAANVADARRSAARLEALASDQAVLRPLAEAPAVTWRTSGRAVVVHPGQLLVVGPGPRSLRALDPATGEVVWTASSAAGAVAARGRCFPVDEGLRPDRLPTPEAGPDGHVACVAGQVAGGAGVTRVVVVDPAGATRLEVTTGGLPLLAEPAGRDLLLVLTLPGGDVRAVRWDLATGRPRWDVTREGVVGAGDRLPSVQRQPGALTVGGAVLDVESGAPVDAQELEAAPTRSEEHLLPDGAVARWAWHRDGEAGRGRVTSERLGRGFGLPGPPLVPEISDGSSARTLVVLTARGDRMRGLDLRDGRIRWSHPYRGPVPVRADALVEGVLLLDDGATVTALDVGTGEPRWRSGVDPGVGRLGAVTDGRVVLLPERGGARLVARQVADGAEVWRTAIPPATTAIGVVDRRLVAVTSDGVVGLG